MLQEACECEELHCREQTFFDLGSRYEGNSGVLQETCECEKLHCRKQLFFNLGSRSERNQLGKIIKFKDSYLS